MIFLKECKDNLLLLKRNLWPIIQFEVVYKLLCACVFTPLFVTLFHWSITLSGAGYLSADTLVQYLTSPASILLTILILFGIALVTLLDILAVIQALHAAHYDQSITLRQMFRAGFVQAKRVFHKNNGFLVLYTVLIVPLTGIVAASGFISTIEIPEFILDYIADNAALSIAFSVASVALMITVMKWALSFHSFAFDTEDFKKARAESVTLMKGHFVHTVIEIIFWEIILFLGLSVISAIVTLIAMVIVKAACPADQARAVALQVAYLTGVTISALYGAFSVPLVFAHISGLYYDTKNYAGRPIPPCEPHPLPPLKTPAKVLLTAVICVFVAANGYDFIATQSDTFAMRQDITRLPKVTASRGDSASAPEDSLPAFQKAIDEGADWIQLDVHQTRDGVIVVTRDADLNRIAGVDKNVYDLTYDELEQYDVGSWFSSDYQDLRVATLDQAIKLCKGKVKLNIELNPTGNEPNFTANVISVIDKNDFRSGCVLASSQLDTVWEVKRLDSRCKTLYIMSIAAGDVIAEPAADAFSLESSSINADMVDAIHGAGKQLFAWTVNEEKNVNAMVNKRVDNIITDDPVNTKEIIQEDRLSGTAQWFVDCFFPDGNP